MKHALWENIFRRDSEKERIFKILKKNVLFQDLSRKELSFVHDIIHVREYRPGERVFQQGEVGVGMYIVVRGSVDILVKDIKVGEEENEKFHVTRLQRGDFFGELSLVEDHGRRSASAIAHEETHLIGFFKPDLMEILERNPNVGVKVVFRLAEVLGKRLVKTTENVSELRKELDTLQSFSESHP